MFSLSSFLRSGPHSWRLSLLFSTAMLSTAIHAAPPSEPRPQVPGYYQQVIGDLRVTALFDGVVPLARSQLVGVDAARIDALLEQRYVPESKDGLQTAVNAYLVQRDKQLVLIDTGAAQCFGDGLGQVAENLRHAGFQPQDVDAVLVTHAHPDHLCGALDAQGAMAFPNATLWLARQEAEYWESARAQQSAPEAIRPLFGMAQRVLAPYAAAGKLRRFTAGDALPAGIAALASPGHTPGHTSFLLDAGESLKLLVWGDVLHYHAVQFASPDASFEVDTDRAQAVASRLNLLQQATAQAWWVAGAHLPFPGLGHVRTEGQAFAWVPGEFSPLPGKR